MSKKFPLTATHWGAYRSEVIDGELVALHDFEEDTDPSDIGHGIVSARRHKTRILAPMVRESWLMHGPGSNPHLRGKEAFIEVTWDQVTQILADELSRVHTKFGASSIFAGSYGWASAGRFHHAQSQMKRFLNLAGGFTSSVFTYSFAAAEAMVPHILGSYREFLNTNTSWRSIAQDGELVVAFGGVPVKNGQIDSGGLGAHVQKSGLAAAHAAGVKFINIGPLKTDIEPDQTPEWLAAIPNTDVAIMMGISHTLISEDLHDPAFMDRYCTGFDQFIPYVMGTTDGHPKDANWAAAISDIPADRIRSLAREMAEKRTVISVSWSLTRADHGEQPFWMAITLAALLGRIGLPGGGVAFGFSATNSIGADYQLMPGASVPQGKNPVPDFIPVARITDMLENPGGRFEFNGQTLTYPDVRMIWWAGGNPYHHHQDLSRLERAWAKPETVVVNDWCWNATARRADIVLPCTTHVERDDICMSQRDPYVIAMRKAVDAPGHALDDHEIFRRIAAKLGFESTFTDDLTPAGWTRRLYEQTAKADGACGLDLPSWEKIQSKGWHKTPAPDRPTTMMQAFRADPIKNRLATPSGKIEVFSQTVADFGNTDCPGHPVWLDPYEWLGNAQADELHLITNQPAKKLHSQLDQGGICASAKRHGREPVLINVNDANDRNIVEGDIVRLFNDRGACLGAATISTDIRPGVVQMSTGAWWDPDEAGMCRHGNPNTLTRDVGTSALGQGPTAHTCLVKIEKYTGDLPKIRAFDPPQIKRPKRG